MTDDTRRRLRLAGAVFAATLVLLLAFIGLLSLVRDSPHAAIRAFGDRGGRPGAGDVEFQATMALLTNSTVSAGNEVELALDGDGTYPQLWRDMRAARRSITFQTYYTEPGGVLDTLVQVLTERAAAGVRTHFLYDAFGTSLPDSLEARLRQAGVHVAAFRPVKWYTLHKAQNRSHVRAVTIDGVLGYTGGFGIDDQWLGTADSPGEWRETNVRFRGPAVSELQATFDQAWAEATGQLLVGDLYFPPIADSAAGGMTAGFLHSPPTFGPTNAALMYALAVAGAERTLYISNAYFVPGEELLEMLLAARTRGVDVRLLLPGPETDVWITRQAARGWYERLLRGGVRIYEYQAVMMHAKTMVVDGVFSTIGSTNLDYRSLALNDEGNLLVYDAGFGATMDSLFVADLGRSREIELATFRQRGFGARLQEGFARAVGRIL